MNVVIKAGLKSCVIMSNHFHLIAYVEKDQTPNQTRSTVLRDMKKFTARQIIKSIQTEPESRREWLLERMAINAKKVRFRSNQQYQLWRYDNHPIALWSPKVIWQKIHYVHPNPVRAYFSSLETSSSKYSPILS